MPVNAIVTLDRLLCIREKDERGGSEPYLWTALVSVDGQFNVSVTAPAVADSRLLLAFSMRAGQSVAIPPSVGSLSVPLDDNARGLILVVAVLEGDAGPVHSIHTGFRIFVDELRSAIADNIPDLAAATNDAERDAVIDKIKQRVIARVTSAIENSLDPVEEANIALGSLDPDDIIGNASQNFPLPGLAPAPIKLAIQPDEGGRLLFYRDTAQDGTGDVNTPQVIGQGGWQNMKFLFSGGNGIIYAVNQEGQLLFYRDQSQDGTGDVSNPSVIGLGGWQDMKFVFSGGKGIIYAVDQDGELLFYRDENQDGTGDVNTPSVIGLGGWQTMKFVFSGGNGIIYAVNQEGQLLFYRDTTQNGTGDVDNPSVIGLGGWQTMQFVFSGGNGVLYAVNQQGQLLFYRDANQDGTGDVNTPSVIGQGGWQNMQFLFSGGNGIIYAVDRFTSSANSYEIQGRLEVQPA